MDTEISLIRNPDISEEIMLCSYRAIRH
jgi:hypothetical protein